ncbi:MAG: hypothetical protein SGPRY_010735, partial [Prymnesium sp.]
MSTGGARVCILGDVPPPGGAESAQQSGSSPRRSPAKRPGEVYAEEIDHQMTPRSLREVVKRLCVERAAASLDPRLPRSSS